MVTARLSIRAVRYSETLSRSPDDAGRCRRSPGQAHRVVQGMVRQVEPDPGEMAARYGADTSILEWRQRLVCSVCGSRQVDMVLSGAKR